MSFTQWSSRRAQARARQQAERGETPEMGWEMFLRLAQNGAKHGELYYRYGLYLQSEDWKARRRAIINACGRQCARCGSTGQLQVHHVHYRTLGREGLADVRVVCGPCHKTDHAGKTDTRVPMTPQQIKAWRAEREQAMTAKAPEPTKVIRRRPKAEPLDSRV